MSKYLPVAYLEIESQVFYHISGGIRNNQHQLKIELNALYNVDVAVQPSLPNRGVIRFQSAKEIHTFLQSPCSSK